MKFALFSYDMIGGSIAWHMQEEGNDVIVGQIQNQDDILLPEQLREVSPEKQKNKKLRLSKYDGMVKKVNAWKLLRYLQTQNPKGWYIFMDLNYCWKFGEVLQSLGFQGNFPTQYDRSLEVHRERAKEFVSKNYPHVKVAEYHSFKKIQEGISFLKTSKISYVLKSLGDQGNTFVPKEEGNEQIIAQLKTQKKEYEQVGFILEEKIDSPRELTPQGVWYNGKPVYVTVDIENKALCAGNVGPGMVCVQNLIVKTDWEDEINKIAFPPIVWEMAKQRKGYFIWDISLLFDKNDVPYFGEFCSGRPGWDAFPTEVAMSGDASRSSKIASRYFERVVGGNPLLHDFGAAVRVFNISEPIKEGIKISWDEGAGPNIYPSDVKKQGKELVTAGYEWDSAVITGVGNTPQESINRCYDYVDMYHLADKVYRVKSDFLSKDYESSIMNRYEYLKKYVGANKITTKKVDEI